MLELYYRLWIAGAFAVTAYLILSHFSALLTFVMAGLGVFKSRTRVSIILGAGITGLGTLVLIIVFFRIDIPLSQPEKALLSLASAQFAAFLPIIYGSFSEPIKEYTWIGWIVVIILLLVLSIAFGTIMCMPFNTLLVAIGVREIYRNASRDHEKGTLEAQVNSPAMKNYAESLGKFTSPKYRLVTDIVSLIVLSAAYWAVGFRSDWILFVAPAVFLVLTNRSFSFLLTNWRKKQEKAQVRAINPFAFAASLLILFSFYISLILKHPDRPLNIYWISTAIFLLIAWYLSLLGRRETTIQIATDAIYSQDDDFQVDTSEGAMDIFAKSLWISHPLFLALGLKQAEVTGQAGSLIVQSWFSAMTVAILLSIIYLLTCLVIWARNIKEPSLSLAGQDMRPAYPEYRDSLAASALPYCVLVPALVFALLNLLDTTPAGLLGFEPSPWLDISVYAVTALVLFGYFVQLPYRTGAKLWKSPKLKDLEGQVLRIRNDIKDRRERFIKSKSSVVMMKNIADELTLFRLRSEIEENKSKKLSYRISWSGEIEEASALVYVLQFLVTAVTTVIASNLEKIVNFVLEIPK